MRLSKSQLSNIFTINGESHDKKYLYGTCPFCNYEEFYLLFLEDNQPNGCSRGKHCGWKGNIWTLLKRLGRSKEFINEREINIREKLEIGLLKEEQELEFDLPEITPPLFFKRIDYHEYLESRFFKEDDYKKYEVGQSRIKKDYITFLVRQDYKLVGYISRSIKSKEEIDLINQKRKEKGESKYLRYDNSQTDFSKCLFGLDEIIEGVTTDVILTEGIFSKTKTDTNLLLDQIDEMKCVATFGAKLSEHQIELLKRKKVKNLWFWFEADVLDKIKPIVANAAIHFNVKVSYLNGMDPNDINEEQAINLLDNVRNYLDFNMNFVKLNLKE